MPRTQAAGTREGALDCGQSKGWGWPLVLFQAGGGCIPKHGISQSYRFSLQPFIIGVLGVGRIFSPMILGMSE